MTREDRIVRGALLRSNPLVLLSIGLCSLVGGLFVTDARVGLVAAAAYLAVGVLVLPTWRYPLLCLAFGLVAAATVTYSTWRGNGHALDPAVVQGVRVVVIAWPGAVAIGYFDPARLGDYLAQALHLPARLVAAFVVALQRFATLTHAWTQIDHARRARGLGPQRNRPITSLRWAASMAFALLVHALRGAGRTAVAMDARGFSNAAQRTWAEPALWSRTDLVVVAGGVLLALVAPLLTLARLF